MNKFELKIGSIYARTTCYVKEKGIDKIEPLTSSCDGFGTEKFTFLLEDGLYLVQDGSNGCGISKRYWLQVYAGEGIELTEQDVNQALPWTCAKRLDNAK